ncbi:MAG TPA: EVE domain-containing protein [Coleofasciculaceae cyanobacterium]|jgi:predicted RNA-binding protein with PUA-like domain
MNYWLMKSEPNVYGIADLARDQQTLWDGVRNYQARNFLREMQSGDRVFFYHSNTEPPGIAGLMQVAESGVIDPTQFDPNSKYFDPKSPPGQPRWQTVTVQFVQAFPTLISLEQLRQTFTPEQLWVVRQGNRLSVLPVERAIAEKILEMAGSSSQAISC